jgi:hypothetical protein
VPENRHKLAGWAVRQDPLPASAFGPIIALPLLTTEGKIVTQRTQIARKPATKFAHLRKKMEQARIASKTSKRK